MPAQTPTLRVRAQLFMSSREEMGRMTVVFL